MSIPTHSVHRNYEGEALDYDREFYRETSAYPTLRYRHDYMLQMVLDLGLPEDAAILDIGCGPGAMVVDLLRQRWQVTGIDIAANMIALAEARVRKAGKPNAVHLAVGDIEHLTFADNSFDVIICSGVVEYLPTDDLWVQELGRVLRPGGVLIINVTNKYALRKWTAPLIEPLKRSKALFRAMDFFKSKVLRRGRLHHFPFRPRTHGPGAFDAFLARHGYTKLGFRYFDFSLLVAPFDTLLGFVTIPIRRGIEARHSHRNWWLSGTGYIVSARLTGKPKA